MSEIVKKVWRVEFLPSIFVNFSKIYSTEFFVIFSTSSFMGNKIFLENIWGFRLGFKDRFT